MEPFFKRFLESSSIRVKTNVKAGAVTLKYLSDSDEFMVTMKYPSDGDDGQLIAPGTKS